MRKSTPAVVAAGALLFTAASAIADIANDVASGLAWRQLGPFRGGWATMVTGVPNAPDEFYFAAAGGGIWRTQDAGRTWSPLFQHGPAASVGAIAIAPSNPKVIYIGTGQPEPRYDIAAGLGVFRSIDGGATWSAQGLADTRYIGAIWVDPNNPDIVLVGAQGHFFGPSDARGIFRSTDGGKSWSHVLNINNWTGVVDIATDPKNPHLLFASAWEAHQYPWQSYFTPVTGSGSAIYKSSDGGVTWTKISGDGWPRDSLGRIGLAVTDTGKGTRVYADVDSKTVGGLYRSDNGGARWAQVNKSTDFMSWYASRLAVAPNDPGTIYTVGQSIRRCTKGGTVCEIFKGAPGGDDYHSVWINPLHPDHMITGSDQGTVISVNGGATWSSWYNQPTGQFYHLAADNRFPYWIYSGQQDSGTVTIASRSDFGAIGTRDWHPVGGDERDYDIPDPVDPMIVYGSGLGGSVSRWDGRTGQVTNVSPWPESSYGKRPTLVRYHYLWVTPLVASRTGTPSLYLGAQVLFRTQDRGAHWTTISGDLTGKRAGAKYCNAEAVAVADALPCGFGSISAIAPSPRSAGEIWVGTDDGLVQLTKDSGANWREVTPKALRPWMKISSIDLSQRTSGIAYVAVDGHRIDDFQPHVYRTGDGGKTWQDISAGLPRDHFVSVVRIDPVKAGLLYAGTDDGVFVSFDNGAHWTPLGRDLPTACVTDLLAHGDDLIAATQGRAIWALDDVTPLRQTADNPQLARLFAPEPAWRVHADNIKDTPLPPETPQGENPSDGIPIDYWLPDNVQGPVTLEIRDARGTVVRRFASNVKAEAPKAERYFAAAWLEPPLQLEAGPGFHRFIWNLRVERPPAVRYSYSIAAVWGRGTPAEPQGAFVLPGKYEIALSADGHTLSAPIQVSEDPRVKVSPADLKASFDLSQRISQILARTRQGYAEQKSVLDQIGKLPLDAKTRPLANRIRAKPLPGTPTFETVDGILTGVESSLEAADIAPTAAQADVVRDATTKLADVQRRWSDAKKGPLAQLNAALTRAHRKPITIPPAGTSEIEAPESGQDLP